MKNLLEKYNRQGPRYTSYPPVPFWKEKPTQDEWISHLKKSYTTETGMDLYVHIPFCEKLCYYCGCNRVITKNKGVQDHFIELLLTEWEMYKNLLGFTPVVNSLHFGGGTPTFLSPENLDLLISRLTQNVTKGFVGSIEIDPRVTTSEHLQCFKKNNITRVSLGIQDFDPTVQKAINRLQSFDLVKKLVDEMRAMEFESINFDVIYGLPKQSVESIRETFKLVKDLRPDLIAFYSYAHLPEKIKNQRLINENDLPNASLKLSLYEKGKEILGEHGYVDVGMDHFALPHNFLYKAKVEQRLHRNFMGYVDKKSPVLLGLGPTSISDSSMSFMQNEKGLSEYELKLKTGSLPLSIGHTHSNDDLKIQKIILDLMCNEESQLTSPANIPYWHEVQIELKDMENDGIIKMSDEKISILPEGKKFTRNIAMAFDYYFREKMPTTKFSKTI